MVLVSVCLCSMVGVVLMRLNDSMYVRIVLVVDVYIVNCRLYLFVVKLVMVGVMKLLISLLVFMISLSVFVIVCGGIVLVGIVVMNSVK